MKYSKGQVSLIAQVLLFSATLMMSLAVFVIFSTANGAVQENIQPRVDYAFSEVKTRSVITSVLNGRLKRSPGVPDSRYGNKTGKRVISAYLSDGYIRHDKNLVSTGTLETDIKSYIELRMEEYYPNSYYKFEIQSQARSLSVSSSNSLQGKAVSYSSPIALTDGEVGKITLLLESEGGAS